MLAPGPGSPNVIIGGKPAWRALPAGTVLPEPPEPAEPEEGEEQTEEEKEAAAAEAQEAAAEMMASIGGGADMHICTQPSPVPFCVDGPGFVIKGSTSVFINGLPAARVGDPLQEILGPPNSITSGCPNVFIGG
jgi:hypothetical protein